MLEEAAQKLRRVERQPFPPARVRGAILEGDAPVLLLEDALGTQRGALHVLGQVAQCLLARAGRLGVDDPFLAPHRWRDLRQEFGSRPQRFTKEVARPVAQDFSRQEKIRILEPDPAPRKRLRLTRFFSIISQARCSTFTCCIQKPIVGFTSDIQPTYGDAWVNTDRAWPSQRHFVGRGGWPTTKLMQKNRTPKAANNF